MQARRLSDVLRVTICQPLAASFVAVAVASFVLADDHRLTPWSPAFAGPLQKRIAETAPFTLRVNLTPSSTELASRSDHRRGVCRRAPQGLRRAENYEREEETEYRPAHQNIPTHNPVIRPFLLARANG